MVAVQGLPFWLSRFGFGGGGGFLAEALLVELPELERVRLDSAVGEWE